MNTFLLAGLLMTLLPPPQTQTGAITGQIGAGTATSAQVRVVAVAAEDPRAVASGTAAVVSLTQADAAGRYRLENVPPGLYYVMAGFLDSPTFYPGATSVSGGTAVAVRAGITIEGMDFILQRSVGVKVSGKVTRDPRAIVYAEQLHVLLSLPQNAFFMDTLVEADGSFEFARVPPGNYSARVYPGSIDYSSVAIEVKDKDLEVPLTVPYTVSIKAHLLVDGLIPRIALAFTNTSGLTLNPSPIPDLLRSPNAVGEDLTIPLPEGEYRVAISQIPDGYELKAITQGNIDLLKEPLKIMAGSSPEIAVMMTPRSPSPWVRVSGRVVGAIPPDSVRVVLTGTSLFRDLNMPVKADGTFEFPQVLPGSYTLRLNPNLAGTTPLAITVPSRDVNDLVFTVPRTRLVTGRLIPDNGSPAVQFQVSLNSASNTSFVPLRFRPTIEADGKFTLTLPEGTYELGIEGIPSGYRIKSLVYGSTDVLKSRTITIAASDTSELLVTSDFTSPSPWVKLSGRVTGTMPSESKLVLVGSGPMRPAPPQVSINPDGSYEFPRVAPGRYMLQFSPPFEGSLGQAITIGDRDVQVDLVVAAVRMVPLQAEMEGAAPLPRLYLGFVRSKTTGTYNPYPKRTNSDLQMTFADGEYRFNSADLPANYRVLSLTYGAVDLLKEPLIIGPEVQTMRVKFGLVAPVSRVQVSGHVSGTENLGPVRGRVIINGRAFPQAPNTLLDQDGNFTIQDVPSGNYTIQALPNLQAPASFVFVTSAGELTRSMSQMPASNVVSVTITDKNVDGIQLVVPVTQRISGEVVNENKAAAAVPFALTLTNTAGTLLSYVTPDAEGKFVVVVPEGDYKIAIENLPVGLRLQSIRRGSVDLTKDALRIAGPSSEELQIDVSTTTR